MASFLPPLFFLSVLCSSANALLTLPIRKDPKTTQFYTTFQMGSNRATINTVLHLGGPYLWFSCDDYTSNTYAPIPCGSTKCSDVKWSGCIDCNGPSRPGCTNNTCGSVPYNPFQDVLVAEAFGEDTFIAKNSRSLSGLAFSCMGGDYLSGLASGTTGLLGLSRADTSLNKQAARKLTLPDRFSLCLPSSGIGKLSIGSAPKSGAIRLLSTPLIINPVSTYPIYTTGDPSDEYFIGVKSISVDGKPLSIKDSYFTIDKNGVGGTKISTIQNFTSLHNSIYKPVIRAFAKAASDLKIKGVAAVPPFGACFSSDSIRKTPAGPSVPEIDLHFPGKDVYWRIRRGNLMVEIDRKTTCLALVDGGSDPRTSIVIGAHQLEENLLEFDLVSSQLRFSSSSLLISNTSCALL